MGGGVANATLMDRGTDTNGNKLIYDTDLDITWYDFSNALNTWQNQVDWADSLSVVFNGSTFDDWRLPTTVDDASAFTNDGSTSWGYNNTTSEMGHLFYSELGNLGAFDTNGNPQAGFGLTNTGDFQNLNNDIYWSGTEFADSAVGQDGAWKFQFSDGRQGTNIKNQNSFFALAVRDGDVAAVASAPVPEPGTMALMGIGMAGILFFRKRIRRQRR